MAPSGTEPAIPYNKEALLAREVSRELEDFSKRPINPCGCKFRRWP